VPGFCVSVSKGREIFTYNFVDIFIGAKHGNLYRANFLINVHSREMQGRK